MIPLVDVRAENAALLEELLAAAREVIESGRLILGPRVEEFERALALTVGSGHNKNLRCVGVSSGTDALVLALQALGVGPGDEVVTTTYSFFATAGAISRLGARPVFVDIEPESFNIDPGKIEAAFTSRTKAVMPVHLYGQCAEMARICEVCGERGVPVVEDAAQALGAGSPAGPAGAIGALGCFSFFPTKNLAACGDAGAVSTSDEELDSRVRRLRVHGAAGTYLHAEVGTNARLDELQAAFLLVKMKRLDSRLKKRRENAARYDSLFAEAGLVERITLPKEQPGFHHTFNQYVIRAPKRDELREHLRLKGIASAVYYPVPLHLQPCFEGLGYKRGDFPEAERASRETLALPIHPDLTEEQQREVVAGVRDFYSDGRR